MSLLNAALMAVGRKSGVLRLRPISFTSAIPNEYNGTTSLGSVNKQVGSTTHHVCMEELTDGSFQVWYPNFGASATYGEWNLGAAATGKATVYWINTSGAQQTTQLTATPAGGGTTITGAAGNFLKFFGPTVRPKAGSHFWITFWGNFPNGGQYSHGKADYLNLDGLTYGATVTDQTGGSTFYGNTWNGGGDYYGPAFIGGSGTRTTFVTDADSREAGVLSGSVADIPDTLYGTHGEFNRLLSPYMAGIDISVPGETAFEMADPTKTPMRDLLAKLCDVRCDGLGVNDMIFNSYTSAQVAAFAATRNARLGLPTIYKTIGPVVTNASTNTVYNAGRDPERRTENTRRRAIAKTYDPSALLENGSTGTLNSLTYTSDGTHNNAVGDKLPLSSYNVPTNFPGIALVDAGFQYPSGALYQSLNLSGWSMQGAGATITNNAIYSPDHKMTAAIIKEGTDAGINVLFQQTIALAGLTKKITCFVKRVNGTRNCHIAAQKNGGSYEFARVAVNLGTGAMFYADNAAGTVSGYTSTLTTDGYWKIEFNVAFLGTHSASTFFSVRFADGAGSDNLGTGNNTSTLAVWGFDVR